MPIKLTTTSGGAMPPKERDPDPMPDPVLVVHTTEGTSIDGAVATMRTNGSECHQVYNPRTGQGVDLVPWDKPARSLRHPSGTPHTNNRGFTSSTKHLGKVYQLEVVGYASRMKSSYSETWYATLARHIEALCIMLGVPIEFPYPFGGDEGYGTRGAYRLSWDQWAQASGIVGHSHVPGNSHWDPGDFTKVAGLLAHRTGGRTVPDRVDLPGNRDATIRRIQAAAGVAVDGDPYVQTAAAVEAMAARVAHLEGVIAGAASAAEALANQLR